MKIPYNFEKVIPTHYQIEILYQLLKERTYTISHQIMPSFEEHEKFVINHPYIIWYLVKKNQQYVGSFYITDNNCIGINLNDLYIKECLELILTRVKKEFIPLPAIRSVRANHFHLNVASNNSNLIYFLEKLNIAPIQITYKI